MSPSAGPTLAVAGATGAVGAVLLRLLEERPAPWGEVRLLASARSAGRHIQLGGQDLVVRELSDASLAGADVVVFDVPDEVSATWVPRAAAQGAVAVDNSGTFRMDPDVPLVVPEVNPGTLAQRPRGIVANPNCTTLSMIVALGALHARYRLTGLVAASYQAASGAGQAGIATLRAQLAAAARDAGSARSGDDARAAVGEALGPFPARLALNVVPVAGSWCPGGWTSEELKIRNETRKILGLPDLPVSATCVRVPVYVGHSVAMHASFAEEVDAAAARGLLAGAPGVRVLDDPAAGLFPTPAQAAGTDATWVGRIRSSLDEPRTLELFVCGDNLRKGAALNALQIAEALVWGTPDGQAVPSGHVGST